MNDNVGSIAYDARIDTKSFNNDANAVENRAQQVANNMENNAGRGFRNFASQASDSFSTVADGLGRILKGAIVLGTTGSVGMGAMAKASWDQVSAVQQATVALNAYEKDTGKVNKTLSELVAYARSDLGVLFNRKDLFAAAQQLKIMGDNTDSLTSHVKIMSRSVGLGLSTFEGLGNVITRVGSTGMLYADDLKFLQNAGFRLDDTMSGTTQTFESLFAALDKGIPADAMNGQANTIVGMGVRLQTAFRNIGDAILGVNKDSGQFVEGGLGSRLVGMLGTLTAMLKNPALTEGFAKMGQSIASFAEKALPILIDGFTWMVNNMDTVVAGVTALGVAFAGAKLAAIGFSIAASANPIGLLVGAVVLLVAGLTFLQVKFNILGKVWGKLQPTLQPLIDIFNTKLAPALERVGSAILNFVAYAVDKLRVAFQLVKPVLQLIGAVMVDLLVNAVNKLEEAFTRVRPWLVEHKELLKQIGLIVGVVLVAPIVAAAAAIVAAMLLITAAISAVANIINYVVEVAIESWQNMKAGYQALDQFFYGIGINIGNTIRNIGMIFGWLADSARNSVTMTISFFASLQGYIMNAFVGAGSWLIGVGKSLIDGLINGIKSSFDGVKKTLGDLTGKLPEWKGPESTDKKILNKNGQYVIGGFIDGLESMYGSVKSSLGGLTTGLSSPGLSPVGSSSVDSLSSLDGAGIQTRTNLNISLNLSGIMTRSKSDERDIAKSLVKRLNEELSAKNQPIIGGGNL